MWSSRYPILVVGAGVSGLTTALALREAGYPVRIVAESPPLSTTSAAAGASWGPYLVSHHLADEWSSRSLEILSRLSEQPASGVQLVTGRDAARESVPAPEWAEQRESFRYCTGDELTAGYVVGWWYRIPLVDMPVYLSFLEKRLRQLGVHVEQGKVTSLRDISGPGRIVVNCTGVGAAELCQDETITPIKGQLVVAENPGIRFFFQDNSEEGEELVYIYPYGDRVVLGGSAKHDATDLTPDEDVAARIVKRCSQIEPSLADARVIEHRVGVRPSRSPVRLEREGNVIHNYGHGGAGVTLSWGCAASVLELVKELGVAHGV